MRRLFSAILMTGLALTSLAKITQAQGLPGMTLLSGPDKTNILNYFLQSGRSQTSG